MYRTLVAIIFLRFFGIEYQIFGKRIRISRTEAIFQIVQTFYTFPTMPGTRKCWKFITKNMSIHVQLVYTRYRITSIFPPICRPEFSTPELWIYYLNLLIMLLNSSGAKNVCNSTCVVAKIRCLVLTACRIAWKNACTKQFYHNIFRISSIRADPTIITPHTFYFVLFKRLYFLGSPNF